MEQQRKAHIIAFASPKGGVGKSTTCLCLGGSLAARGHKVTILDLDQNRTLEQWYQRFPNAVPGLTVRGVREGDLMAAVTELYYTAEGFVLLDVAGAFTTATITAATVADLTVSPAKLSAPDVIEARKLSDEIKRLADRISKPINHRLLLNEVSPLWPTYQRAMLTQAERSGVPLFDTIMNQRAPYAEVFLTGQPPHFADKSREPIIKAIAQLDAFTDEVLAALDALDVTQREAA